MSDGHATTNPRAASSPDEPTTGKKPFEPPRLTIYGDITALTLTVGRLGLADGGKGQSNNRTHA